MKELCEKVEAVCDELAEAVNQHLFDGYRTWWWMGDLKGGAVCFDDTDFLNMEEMLLILKFDIQYDYYAEWRDWNLYHANTPINLKSWIRGLRPYMLNENTDRQ